MGPAYYLLFPLFGYAVFRVITHFRAKRPKFAIAFIFLACVFLFEIVWQVVR